MDIVDFTVPVSMVDFMVEVSTVDSTEDGHMDWDMPASELTLLFSEVLLSEDLHTLLDSLNQLKMRTDHNNKVNDQASIVLGCYLLLDMRNVITAVRSNNLFVLSFAFCIS